MDNEFPPPPTAPGTPPPAYDPVPQKKLPRWAVGCIIAFVVTIVLSFLLPLLGTGAVFWFLARDPDARKGVEIMRDIQKGAMTGECSIHSDQLALVSLYGAAVHASVEGTAKADMPSRMPDITEKTTYRREGKDTFAVCTTMCRDSIEMQRLMNPKEGGTTALPSGGQYKAGEVCFHYRLGDEPYRPDFVSVSNE